MSMQCVQIKIINGKNQNYKKIVSKTFELIRNWATNIKTNLQIGVWTPLRGNFSYKWVKLGKNPKLTQSNGRT